jgi:hypothetical protein
MKTKETIKIFAKRQKRRFFQLSIIRKLNTFANKYEYSRKVKKRLQHKVITIMLVITFLIPVPFMSPIFLFSLIMLVCITVAIEMTIEWMEIRNKKRKG